MAGRHHRNWWTPCSGISGRIGPEYAETIIGLYKTELVYRNGPWSRLEDIELATLEYVWWFNSHRLLKPIGLVPPAEYEAAYYLRLQTPPELETLNTNSLR